MIHPETGTRPPRQAAQDAGRPIDPTRQFPVGSRYIVSTVIEYLDRQREQQSRWYEIGAAWPTKNGEGLTVVLHAAPVSGKLVIMPYKPDEDRR